MTEVVDATKLDKAIGGKPLQTVTYTEKTKNDNNWAKATMNYLIDTAVFDTIGTVNNANQKELGITNIQQLYDFYNNEIPSSVFDYVKNPLKAAGDSKYNNFPAKIRPYNIIRPNIDLLIGEWNKRPFLYDVVNVDGDDAFNAFVEFKTGEYRKNLTQRIINKINEIKQANGEEPTDVPSEDIPDPKTLISSLNLNYKDAKALQGYRALKVLENELKFYETWRALFKDWVIAGSVATLKIPIHGNIEYIRVSPRWVARDRSCLSPYYEDGDHCILRFRMSTSEMVDLFYDKLSKEDVKELEKIEGTTFANKMYNMFTTGGQKDYSYKHDVFYVTWKTKKTIGFLTYRDPFSGEEMYDIVDEAYKPDLEVGEKVEWMVVNEVYEGWRYNDDKFIGIGPVAAQRNEMNNFSTCKLPVNGKAFSDTESNNVSVCYLSIPYQILYIILMYRMELTIAKSKGKIVLLDANVIPDEDEGGEEAFFWYSEAMGYALVHRDQEGVDKSWNQYQVLDLSLFQHIKELMVIMDYVKAQLEELLGITRQRKGDINSSDGLGTSEQAIFRGNVISDLIFTGFEEFLERELQGLLDCSKFAWVDGKKGYWRNDEGRMEMLALDPDDYASSEMGVFVQNMSKYLDKFNMLKQQVNALAQRKDTKVSTIIEMISTDSMTELKALVKKAEAAEQAIIAATAANEAEAKKELQESQQDWEVFMHGLELDMMEREWDRKDNNEYIKASLDKDPAAPDNSNIVAEVEKQATERLKLRESARQADAKIRSQEKLENSWMTIEKAKMKSQERIAKTKASQAKKKASK